MTPIRVTAPTGPVVSVEELRRQCRVSPNSAEFDDQLIALEQAAVSTLDGWRGLLGRCILQQRWSVEVEKSGVIALPFPDVTEVSASSGSATLLGPCATGSRVDVSAPCTLTMTLELPEDSLPAVRQAICIWVQKRFDGLTGNEALAFERAFDDLIRPIRWGRV